MDIAEFADLFTDRISDHLYRRDPFATDADRVALLFTRYQELTEKN